LFGPNFEYLLTVAPHSTNGLTQDPTVQFVRSATRYTPNQTDQRYFKTISKMSMSYCLMCLSSVSFPKTPTKILHSY